MDVDGLCSWSSGGGGREGEHRQTHVIRIELEWVSDALMRSASIRLAYVAARVLAPPPSTNATNPTTTPEMTQNITFALTEPHKSHLATVLPWYYNPAAQLHHLMSDFWLSLLAPVAAYWLFCTFFEALDRTDWRWLKRYKIHESSEVTSRNRVSKRQVLAAVTLQHVIQITLGYFWMDTNAETGVPIAMHVPRMEAIAPTVLRSLEVVVGRQFAAHLWLHKAQDLVYYTYWWAIPLTQLLVGL